LIAVVTFRHGLILGFVAGLALSGQFPAHGQVFYLTRNVAFAACRQTLCSRPSRSGCEAAMRDFHAKRITPKNEVGKCCRVWNVTLKSCPTADPPLKMSRPDFLEGNALKMSRFF
jgi:hypothetical protein